MNDEEQEIIPLSYTGKGCGANCEETRYGEETENDIAVLDAFKEEGLLDVEVEVEGGVEGEENEDYPAEGTVVGVEFFVGETCDV